MTARASLLISLLAAGAGIAVVVLLTDGQVRAVLLPVPLIAATYLHRFLQATYGVASSGERAEPGRFYAALHNEDWRHEHPLVFSVLMALAGAGLLAGMFALDGTLSDRVPAVVALLCILPIAVRLGLVYEASTK